MTFCTVINCFVNGTISLGSTDCFGAIRRNVSPGILCFQNILSVCRKTEWTEEFFSVYPIDSEDIEWCIRDAAIKVNQVYPMNYFGYHSAVLY